MAAELDGYVDFTNITNNNEPASLEVRREPPPRANPEYESLVRRINNDASQPQVVAVQDAIQAAQDAAAGNPEAQRVVQQSLGPLQTLSQFGSFGRLLATHLDNIINDGTRIFRAINNFFQPGRAQEPSRCATVGDYIGTIQGRYNSTLGSIASSIGQVVGAIVSIPARIIGALTSAISGLIGAIVGGVSAVVQLAAGVVRSAVGVVTGALGAVSSLLGTIGAGISQVTSAVARETQNITTAVTSGFASGFSRSVSGVNPCVASAQQGAPVAQFGTPPT
jgi:hypothetical protein